MEEYAERLNKSKLKVEENLENIRLQLEQKQQKTLKRFNELMAEREKLLNNKKEENKKKYMEIHQQLEQIQKKKIKKTWKP